MSHIGVNNEKMDMFEVFIVRMQGLGQASALNNPLLNVTMFAPVNSAFQAPLPVVSLSNLPLLNKSP